MIHPTLTIGLTILAAYSLLLLECFLPSGGVLAVTSVLFLLGAVVLGFSSNATTGLLVVLIIVVGTPLLIRFLVILWPSTRIGRKILNRSVIRSDRSAKTTDNSDASAGLVGVQGIAVTDLKPNGIASIRGRQWDVVTEGDFVPKGCSILVTRHEIGRLHVRRTLGNPAKSPTSATLEQPIEFAIDTHQTEPES